MGKSFLITQSLISSIDWFKTAPSSPVKGDPQGRTWRTKAYHDLRDMLARKPWEKQDPATQRGINFENNVYDIIGGIHRTPESETEAKHLQWFVDQIKGGKLQYSDKEIVTLDGEEFCLYVKLDAYFPTAVTEGAIGRIDDIKTTSSYTPGKYLNGFQHLLYCHVLKTVHFRYLVQPYDKQTGEMLEPQIEEYRVSDFELLKQIVYNKVREARKMLREFDELNELFENVYTKSWN